VKPVLVVLFCLFIYPSVVFSQNLQFYREDLTFEIKEGYFYVDGIYNFCNNSDKMIRQVLFYPFPEDSLFGKVDSIKASDVILKSGNIITQSNDKGFYFKVEINPYGVGKYRISYRQKLLRNKAEYILLTTQKWGKPFENSLYKLIIPDTLKITSTSYTPDSTEHVNQKEIFYWNKKDFMPDKNMIFYFKQ
jgi:hypothetical protein